MKTPQIFGVSIMVLEHLLNKYSGERSDLWQRETESEKRDASRFSGVHCEFSGRSVRADLVEKQIGRLMESLILPDNWQESLQKVLNHKKAGPDPQKEKARIRGEIRRMRKAYKRGLYKNDEHSFWSEIETLQMHWM